ncbi:hypothetical protein [Mesorhizobium loti]|uniref:Uncharacterized protein n=1 Tax=Mesorhizobium loti R88b TaxID=935548 RepID=A0A6M7WG73_RHILI|nr:hypothetical protein [Mesorhizobium loti]QKD01492.1 hypothetical protein EB235_08185 [Mesorhizobium loti R88b]
MGKTAEERIILAVGAFLIALASLVGVLVAFTAINALLPDPPNIPGVDIINPKELRRDAALALYFTVAATWAYLVWDSSNFTWRRGWLYGISVSFFGALSLPNYLGGDLLVPLWWQAVINIPFAFVSIVCAILIWNVRFGEIEARVLKHFTLFTLATFGIALPIVFNIFYAAVRMGILDKDNITTMFMSGAIYILSAIAGIAVTALNYLVMEGIKVPPVATPPA